MLSEPVPVTVLVLLAHQDDEFALQPMLIEAVLAGWQVHCAYFTQAPQPALNAQRNAESLQVLKSLGLPDSQVHWPGQRLDIVDGRLWQHLPACAAWLQLELQRLQPAQLWLPAWEGGHPDHDALHACGVLVSQRLDRLARVRQFPLYNGWQRHAPWFRVLTPLPDNGPVQIHPMPWRMRWRCLQRCLSYPSQWRSWLGLLPPVAWHLLVKGRLYSQPVSVARLQQRPHPGRLYYEARGFADWDALGQAVMQLQDQLIPR